MEVNYVAGYPDDHPGDPFPGNDHQRSPVARNRADAMTERARAELDAARQELRDLVMSDRLEEAVRQWLIRYAWYGTPAEQIAMVGCIMAQDGWKYVDAVADQYAGAQWEPGEEAFADGAGYALSALYECHAGPHLASCPCYREGD